MAAVDPYCQHCGRVACRCRARSTGIVLVVDDSVDPNLIAYARSRGDQVEKTELPSALLAPAPKPPKQAYREYLERLPGNRKRKRR